MANQKRISELPIINTLSGSAVSVIPVVVGGTTNQISAENFSKFVNAYNATTSSNNFIGNQTITGNLVVSGDLTAERYYIETISSSVIYESGSTEFGNSGDDVHTFTGSIVLNGTTIGLGELNAQTASQNSLNTSLGLITSSIYGEITSLNSALLGVSSVTGAMNTQSSSQDLVNFRIASTTGSINTTTSSFDSVFLRISSTTGSINTTTSSFDLVFRGISSVTGSINTTTSSFDSVFLRIASTTGSINTTTSSFDLVFRGVSSVTGAMNTQSSSQDLVNLGISSVTGSLIGITNGLMAFTAALDDNYATDAQLYQLYQATRSLEIQTGSQNSLNTSVGLITSSIYGEITSFNNVFGGVSAVTGAFTTTFNSIDSHILKQSTQTGSQDLVNRGISSVTGSINTTTSSFNSVFSQIGSTTSSLIGITNGLMAFTAALDSTYATDAQLVAAVSGLNTQTGSQNSINSGISAVTGAFATELAGIQNNITSFNNVFGGVSAVTGAFATELSGIQTKISGHRNELDGLESYTASLKAVNLVSGSSQLPQIAELFTQNTSQAAVNLGISTFTGSLRNEVNGIEAYTASLKSAFTIDGNNDVYFSGKITTQEVHTTYTTSSVLFQSGSTKFGNSSDDIHEFTGSKFEVYNSDSSGTMYAVVKNNRARNAAVKTTTTNGSFIAGTSIGTDTFQYQIYDEVEGVNRVTINSQGGTTLQGAVTASQGLTVNGTNYAFKAGGGGAAHQTLVGQCTAEASTVAKKIAFVGFTHAIRVNVWAIQDSSNGVTAVADFTTLYGSSNGGVVYSSPFGNISSISMAYDNGGSPSYTINVTLTYTGTAPQINYSIVGLGEAAFYSIT